MYPSKQSGSMLVISIFVILVMSVLGITLTRVLSASSDSVIHEVYGVRALNAAKSGLEQHVFSVFGNTNVNANNCNLDLSSTAAFSASNGFDGCTYQTECQRLDINGTGYFQFSSTGTCQVTNGIVINRTVAVDARNQ